MAYHRPMATADSFFARQPRRKWTAAEVSKLVEVGVLGEDDPLELIEGELIEMTPQGPPHSRIIHRLTMKIARACPPGISVAVRPPWPPRSSACRSRISRSVGERRTTSS